MRGATTAARETTHKTLHSSIELQRLIDTRNVEEMAGNMIDERTYNFPLWD